MSDAPRPPALDIAPATAPGPRHSFTHDAMACEWGLCIVGGEAGYAHQAAHAAFEEVDRVEQELSRFIPHSDVARLNATPAGQPLRVGVELLECLTLAAQLCEDTNGAFDVTVGGLLHASSAPASRPVKVGMRLLGIDPVQRAVVRREEGVVVDLGGIGKGYALDRAAAVLGDWSIERALLHSGQSTACIIGPPADASVWTVAVRDPTDPAKTLGSIRLTTGALSGSGALLHGRHIIDPRSEKPATGILGAWAHAPTGAFADALSTAFMVLSPTEADDVCRRRPGSSALQLVESADGPRLHAYGDLFASLAAAGGSG
ncbi:MAG: FAD:protein FMN transferase [Phycisphaerae bacterium]|jgi:thiamine biosynthesis lipoprotein